MAIKEQDRLIKPDRIPQGGYNESQCLSMDNDGESPMTGKTQIVINVKVEHSSLAVKASLQTRDLHCDSIFKYHFWSES